MKMEFSPISQTKMVYIRYIIHTVYKILITDLYIYIYIYTPVVKKNCSHLLQIITWLAAVGSSLSQSSSGSGSRSTLTMFNLHLFVIFLFSSSDLQIFNTPSKFRLLQNIADTLATAHLINSLPL